MYWGREGEDVGECWVLQLGQGFRPSRAPRAMLQSGECTFAIEASWKMWCRVPYSCLLGDLCFLLKPTPLGQDSRSFKVVEEGGLLCLPVVGIHQCALLMESIMAAENFNGGPSNGHQDPLQDRPTQRGSTDFQQRCKGNSMGIGRSSQ